MDGIAVQCQDLINMPEENKIYLEEHNKATEKFQDFLNAHYSKNYGWIFTAIPSDKKGFVKEEFIKPLIEGQFRTRIAMFILKYVVSHWENLNLP